MSTALGTPVLGAAAAALTVALLLPVRPTVPLAPAAVPRAATPAEGGDWLRRWRLLWVALAALAAYVFLGGLPGLLAAPAAGAATWVVIDRAEPAAVRRDRDAARRDLPHVVGLLADALRAGQSAPEALAVVAAALPGPASARLAAVVPRLRLGLDPATVFTDLAADPALAPLGRALARAHRTGAPVTATVDRLATELAGTARADLEDRARAIGVRAAVPLGLCLLPAFLLLGIVPVVAGLFAEMSL
jgi:Flp pilus assembly protein TadB